MPWDSRPLIWRPMLSVMKFRIQWFTYHHPCLPPKQESLSLTILCNENEVQLDKRIEDFIGIRSAELNLNGPTVIWNPQFHSALQSCLRPGCRRGGQNKCTAIWHHLQSRPPCKCSEESDVIRSYYLILKPSEIRGSSDQRLLQMAKSK